MPRFCFQRANLWLEGYFMSSVAAATKFSKSEPSVHWYLTHHSSSSLSVTLVCILHSWLVNTYDDPKLRRNIKNEWHPDPTPMYMHQETKPSPFFFAHEQCHGRAEHLAACPVMLIAVSGFPHPLKKMFQVLILLCLSSSNSFLIFSAVVRESVGR